MPNNIIQYTASPVGDLFHKDKSFVKGIMGPVGSGKSVICCFEIFMHACQQEPNADGVRKSRWLVVRNTLPQLESTTMKTWTDWFPPGEIDAGKFGKLTRKPPYTHHVMYKPDKDTVIDMEVQFIALDKPEDQRKLLSYECSGIWFNEAREIDFQLINMATSRVGRYPSQKDGGCTHKSIIMDTNPPDDSHWWYHLAEEETPNGWAFFRQPSGLSDKAENLENLNQGEWRKKFPRRKHTTLSVEERRQVGRSYYEDMSAGKTEEWNNVYVHGEYGFVKEGQPVYGKSWNPDLHVAKEDIPWSLHGEIVIGVDASGRHPSAVFIQKSYRGQWQVVHELCITDDDGMSASQFAPLLRNEIRTKFPDNLLRDVWADPAGGHRGIEEYSYFDILRMEHLPVRSAPTNKLQPRIETVINVLNRMVDGQPALIVSPACKHLIRGFNGGYHYRKISTAGDYRYDKTPTKNRFSDVQDALQYALCGAGELRRTFRSPWRAQRTIIMDQNWKV